MLVRDDWKCRGCGRIQPDAHADHIVPVSEGGARYDVANGQTLCASCHGRKTRGEQARRQAGSHGEARQDRASFVVAEAAAREGGQNHPNFAR